MNGDFKNVDIDAMKQIAETIAATLKIGSVVFLRGVLGAGKTTFAQMIINCITEERAYVTSPTFNIVHQYQARNNTMLWHFDLYRVKTREELEHIGIDEAAREGISIIEWPELVESSNYWTKDMIVDVFIDFVEEIKNNMSNIKNYDYIRNISIKKHDEN